MISVHLFDIYAPVIKKYLKFELRMYVNILAILSILLLEKVTKRDIGILSAP
jgi:hypothetical protein